MDSRFGEVFLFLTNLAWKSRITIPLVLTTVLMAAGIRLQVEINIHAGPLEFYESASESEIEDDDDDDFETAESENESEYSF